MGKVALAQQAGQLSGLGRGTLEMLDQDLVGRRQLGQRPGLGHGQPGGDVGRPARVMAGQLREALAHRARHPAQRARVVGVVHQQMQQRRYLAARLELRAVGDGGVEHAQQQREAVFGQGQALGEGLGQHVGVEAQALDLPADGQQPPAIIAGHAVGLRAGDRGEVGVGPRQHIEHIGQRRWAGAVQHRAQMLLELRGRLMDQPPGLGRQAFAQRLGAGLQRPQIPADAGDARARQQGREQCALKAARVVLGARRLGADEAMAAGQRVQQRQHRRRHRAALHHHAGLDDMARQPGGVFRPLGVAAEPEQVFGGPAGDGPVHVAQVGGLQGLGEQRGRVDLAVGHHPGVGAQRAALDRQPGIGQRVAARRDTGQAARQHLPAPLAIGQRKDAQHRHARLQRAAYPHRLLGGLDARLQRVGGGVGIDAIGQRPQRLAAELGGHDGREAARGAAGREGWHDDVLRQARAQRAPGAFLATPPALDGRQLQRLAEQPFGHAGPEGGEAGAFQPARTRRVGHDDLAGPHRLQQPRHTEDGVGLQFERVQPGVVHPAQQHMHALQAGQGLQIDLVGAHGQVGALDQRDAEVARQEGLLEIGLVARARRQQRDAAALAGRRELHQRLHQVAVAGGQPLHRHLPEGLGELLGNDEAVLQHIAEARGRLGALANHPPVAVRAAGQVEGQHMQMHAAARRAAMHLAQVLRVGQH
mmetsp:Transcript_3883/g.13736  ORF Transcript_3883/g.13736 Transcript_3883/m.13736 type:complete len:703 (-) Transcript_3883:3695-5803(-)